MSGQVHALAALPARRKPGTLWSEVVLAPELVWMILETIQCAAPAGFKLQTVQPIACHHTTYAIETPVAKLHNESCDFETLYSWQISSCVKIYISNPMLWLLWYSSCVHEYKFKTGDQRHFHSVPKTLFELHKKHRWCWIDTWVVVW